MRNTIPEKVESLRVMAEAVAGGVALYGNSLPLLKTTPANMTAEIAAAIQALTAHRSAKEELDARRATVREVVVTVREFLTNVRDTCKAILGHHHNENWAVTGLDGSLMIPRSEAPVVGLVGSFKEFLATHPQFEIPVRNITAQRAGLLFTQLSNARNAVNVQSTLVRNRALDRDAKAAVLSKRISIVMAELRMHLSPVDSRWLAFGLNKPGARATPDVPSNVTVVAVGPTGAAVKWDRSARAEYYRIWSRNSATQPWLAAGKSEDLDFMFEEMQRDTETEVAVSAVNAGGESTLSEFVTVMLPIL